MWKRTLLPAIIALTVGGAAQAALDRIEEAYEVALADVVLPVHEEDRVTLQPCPDCERVYHRVNSETRYLVRGTRQALSLKDFRETAATVINRRDTLVYVMYATDSRIVTRLILDAPDR